MPNLSKAARDFTSVRAFHNTATPTISAMTALLCSVPPTHPREMSPGSRGEVRTPHCLSDLLKRAGYRTRFIMAAPSSRPEQGDFLRHHGFDRVLDKAHFDARFPDRGNGVWGPTTTR